MIDPGILGRRVVEVLTLPPGGPLLLLALACLLMRRRPRLGRGLAVLAFATLWLGSTPGVGHLLTAPLEDAHPPLTTGLLSAAQAGSDPPRAIVVLGGGNVHDLREQPAPDRPKGKSLARLVQGAGLARNTGLPLLLSGGAVQQGTEAEARTMARIARDDLRVEPRWVEDRSLDTFANARESARELAPAGVHSIILVTSAIHMARSVELFEAAGFRVLPAPTAFSGREPPDPVLAWLPSGEGAQMVATALHEWVGIGWYRLRSGIVRSRTPTMSRSETPYPH